MRPTRDSAATDRWMPWLVNGGIAAVLRALVPMTIEPSGERYRYVAMGWTFPIPHCPSFHCFRILPPLFTSLLPLEAIDAFIATGLLFHVLATVVLFHLTLRVNGTRRVAWLTVLWYWATWAPILSLNDPLLITDPVQAFWSFTALYLLFDRRFVSAFFMLIAGAAVKESLLLIAPIYAAYALLSGDRERPSLGGLALLCAAPIAAWVALRAALHYGFGYVVSEDVGYVRQTYFFGVWLKNLAPWPANLRLGALYIFGSFGAAWLFAAVGLGMSDRRQRALTLASIPAMAVLMLLQVPDRALASFPYAILIPAAILTARLPTPLAAVILLINAAFTVRMNAGVHWLPTTTVILAVLAVVSIVCVVVALRGRTPAPDAPARSPVRKLAWAAMAVALMFAVRAAWHEYMDPPALRLALPADVSAVADDDGGTPGVETSPDGRRVVFVGITTHRIPQLYLRSLTASSETPVAGTEGASAPFWSPDGTRIGFFANGSLKTVTLADGAVATIAAAPHPRGGAWGAHDTIVFAPEANGGLAEVSATGGSIRAVTTVPAGDAVLSHRWPSFLPDGERFLFVGAGAASAAPAVFLGARGRSAVTRVLEDGRNPRYVQPGLLMFERNGRLWTQPFDLRREAALGSGTVIASGVAHADGFGRAAFSSGGTTLAMATDTARSALPPRVFDLRWLDRSGLPVGDLNRLSQLNASLINGIAATDDPDRLVRAAVSRDRNRYGVLESIVTSANFHEHGRQGDRVLARGLLPISVATSWSPDGSTVLFHAQPAGAGSWDIWALSLATGQAAPLVNSAADEVQGQFSPDGRWIAYAANTNGRFEIYARPYPGPGAAIQISVEGGFQPRWSPDGTRLFFIIGDRVLAEAAVETSGGALKASAPRERFPIALAAMDATHYPYQFLVAPDGESFLVESPAGRVPPPSGRIAMWLNWRRGLTEP